MFDVSKGISEVGGIPGCFCVTSVVGTLCLAFSTQWMSSEHVGQSKASPYCFVFGVKILSCNLTVGNLISDISHLESCKTSATEPLCKNSQRSQHIDYFCKKAPPQTLNVTPNADPI